MTIAAPADDSPPVADEPPRPSRRQRWEARLAVGLAVFGLLPLVGVLFSGLTRPTCNSGVGECSYAGRVWNVASTYPWSVVAQGSSLRFELRKPDPQVEPQGPRDGFQAAAIRLRDALPFDRDIWFGFDLMIEPGAPPATAWLSIGTVGQAPNPGHIWRPPGWSQSFDQKHGFRIGLRSGAGLFEDQNPPEILIYQDPAFQRGHWYHFLYRLHYSQTIGAMDAWRDGRPIAAYRGPLGYVTVSGPRLDIGIARAVSSETLAVRFANLTLSHDACATAIGLRRLHGPAVTAGDCEMIAP